MSEAGLNDRQLKVLAMMRAKPERDIYEGSAPPNGKHGSGEFWLTYSADETYHPLTWPEVREMEQRGLIVERWPGCYKLTGANRHDHRGRIIV